MTEYYHDADTGSTETAGNARSTPAPPPLKPDLAVIDADLRHMTARWAEIGQPAVFEIRAIFPGKLPQGAVFAPDAIPAAVDYAAHLNGEGYGVYVTRNPIRADVSGSAKDADVLGAFSIWADADDGDAADNIRRFDGPKAGHVVVTGEKPSIRAHVYWPLEEFCADLSAWRQAQRAIAAHFKSDPAVCNPSRIMRLAGTINYPDAKKAAKGYVTCMVRAEHMPGRAPVTLDQMQRVFGTAASAPAPAPVASDTPAPAHAAAPDAGKMAARVREALDAIDPEKLSRDDWRNAGFAVASALGSEGAEMFEEWSARNPARYKPGEPGAIVENAKPDGKVTIGTLFALARQHTPGFGATLAGWNSEADRAEAFGDGVAPADDVPDDFRVVEVAEKPHGAGRKPRFISIKRQERRKPDWLVKGMFEAGTMGTLFGDPGCGKSFLALHLSMCIATGAPFLGRDTKTGRVLYIAGEGMSGLQRRVEAWEKHHGVESDPDGVLLYDGTARFLDKASAQEVSAAADAAAKEHGDVALIVIDTLARAFAGGDENSNSDATAFVAVLDMLRRRHPGCVVMLVHHSGHEAKNRARGASAFHGADDWTYSLRGKQDKILGNPKMKDRPEVADISLRLQPVALEPFDGEDEDAASAVVVEAGIADWRAGDVVMTPRMTRGVAAYRTAYVEAVAIGAIPPPPEDDTLALPPLAIELWRQEFYKGCTADSNSGKKNAFNRVRGDLVEKSNVMAVESDHYSLTRPGDIASVRAALRDAKPRSIAAGVGGASGNSAEGAASAVT